MWRNGKKQKTKNKKTKKKPIVITVRRRPTKNSLPTESNKHVSRYGSHARNEKGKRGSFSYSRCIEKEHLADSLHRISSRVPHKLLWRGPQLPCNQSIPRCVISTVENRFFTAPRYNGIHFRVNFIQHFHSPRIDFALSSPSSTS
jgi:hypothetical protein